jgi:Family of unknown function (DUF5681)
MSGYQVGYGKPPKHSQFQKGICPNPKGRGSGRDLKLGDITNKVLHTPIAFRDGGKLKKASRLELMIRRLAVQAMKGDVASAAQLLTLRAHAQKHGDTGPLVIRITGGLPDLDRNP